MKERKANKAKEKERKGSSSKMKDDEAEDNRLAIETVVQKRSAKGDEVEWFKGAGYARLLGAFIAPEDDDGPGEPRYDTECLKSTPPTDFSRRSSDTYWAKTRQLVEVYAAYSRGRNLTDIRTGILHIIIPKATVAEVTHFKETKHWNEYVWHNSVSRKTTPGTPNSEQILIGQVLDISRDQILGMRDAGESSSALKAKIFASGESATQIACKGSEIHERLNADGRMWLEEWNCATALPKKVAEEPRRLSRGASSHISLRERYRASILTPLRQMLAVPACLTI